MVRITTFEDRVRILALAQAKHTDSEIATLVGYAVATVRKWRRRGQNGQPLCSKMGRPAKGSLSSYPPLLRETLRAWRVAHPGWGAATLLAELQADKRFSEQKLPGRRDIARFLKAQGLVRAYHRHSQLPAVESATAQAPHEEWEMDARGYEHIAHVGMVALINLNDRCSHARLLSFPCLIGQDRVERHPCAADYQIALRLAFCRWGLPDRLRVDHESVFYDNLSPSPFPTPLHLWLLALGISLLFGRVDRPTDLAMTERSHQLWAAQVLEGQTFADWDALYQALTQRLPFLNERLPCATLQGRPPLLAYPEIAKPRRFYRPECEAALLDLTRVYEYLSRGHWFRFSSNVGAVSLGGHWYTLGVPWAKQQVEITFDLATHYLVFHSAKGDEIKRLPLRAVTVEELSGEKGALAGLPAFQLALPLTPQQWRELRLYDTLLSRLNVT